MTLWQGLTDNSLRHAKAGATIREKGAPVFVGLQQMARGKSNKDNGAGFSHVAWCNHGLWWAHASVMKKQLDWLYNEKIDLQ